uniref:Cysteine-rich secretory protein LCCL domain containing 2 n=1 Tax=Eptatretus burgeri TaxID=7764 RepID=A0A8C4QUC8_EPTBU
MLHVVINAAQTGHNDSTNAPSAAWNQLLHRLSRSSSSSSNSSSSSSSRRQRRAIESSDQDAILKLHNKLRSSVSPSASNMEYIVWDDDLARSASSWAAQCHWDHGPSHELSSIGQNLGVHWGQYRPPTFHVQAWFDEVRHFTYPYPQECNPSCPFRCSGPVCTHYTQMVWATSNRVGCAINLCYNMNVWGQVWKKAVYLVCNYSPKGNWWGDSPYRAGPPCSECPPSYGGRCRDNMCYRGIEVCHSRHDHNPSEIVSIFPSHMSLIMNTNFHSTILHPAAQLVNCETKLRDRCKGTTCNRCIYFSHLSFQHSSICLAAIHYGVLDNRGGWVDVTRKGKVPFFVRSDQNGIKSVSLDCFMTVDQLCPFRQPTTHCPRIYCPANCMQMHYHQARVIGTRVYLDRSSICRSAVHSGVISNNRGGYIDVMPSRKKRQYLGSFQNGVLSESIFILYSSNFDVRE